MLYCSHVDGVELVLGYTLFFHDDAILTLLLCLHGNQILIVFFVFLVFFAQSSPKLVLLDDTLVHVFSFLFGCFHGLDVL